MNLKENILKYSDLKIIDIKEIVYDLVPWWITYEVDDEKIKELEKVPYNRIQELINFICLTSKRCIEMNNGLSTTLFQETV